MVPISSLSASVLPASLFPSLSLFTLAFPALQPHLVTLRPSCHLPPLRCLLRHPHSLLGWVSPSAVSSQTSLCTQHWLVPKIAAETCHSWREGQLACTQRVFHLNLRVPLLQCISPPGRFQVMLTPWCGSCEVLGVRLILAPGFPLISLVRPQSHSYNESEKKVTPHPTENACPPSRVDISPSSRASADIHAAPSGVDSNAVSSHQAAGGCLEKV